MVATLSDFDLQAQGDKEVHPETKTRSTETNQASLPHIFSRSALKLLGTIVKTQQSTNNEQVKAMI